MCLIGIDIGTSSVKVAAYREDGVLLVVSRMPVRASHPSPGWEEMDPDLIWQSVLSGLHEIANSLELRCNPPVALAISASGDEVFLTDESGSPLTPCILSGDTRGAEIEAMTLGRASRADWYAWCGHVPERMDPVNRLIWWQTSRPDLFSNARYYLGWHEFIAYRLCGQAVTDPSLASKWLAFDLSVDNWSSDRCFMFNLDESSMPRVQPWGQPIAEIREDIANLTGLPKSTLVCTGAFDSNCAAIGSGVSNPHVAGLTCGSWQVVVAPIERIPHSQSLFESGFPVTPFPGEAPYTVLAQSPNGAAVMDWLAHLADTTAVNIENSMPDHEPGPGPILSIPHFSGAISPWVNGRDSRGAFIGLTLATSRQEVFKSLVESVTFDLHLTLEYLKLAGVLLQTLRASGGGSRSAWWMQLIADLLDTTVEVVAQEEPGAFGAALLAGVSIGLYPSVGEAAKSLVRVHRRYEPNPRRKQLYADRMELYLEAVPPMMKLSRKITHGTK